MRVKDLYSVRTAARQYIQSFARAKNCEWLSDEEADRLFLDADNAILIDHNAMLAFHAATALNCLHPAIRGNFLAALRDCSTIEAAELLVSKALRGGQNFLF